MRLNDLQDVLAHEVKDLYSAEKQLVEALPKMAKAASDERLRKAMEKHLEVTRQQVARLEEVGKTLGTEVTGHACEGMKGLIKEAEGLLKENEPSEALDVALISAAQRVEHYEIAAYGSAVAFAKELGHHDVARTLQQTLDEEGQADKELTDIAESRVNQRAEA
ncbi:MAG TPA: ferritin-like domain-containing protein [Trueperaceae bacterium]|nr:ferritin-like domain-containing protein [Trueperaceae bacterium]